MRLSRLSDVLLFFLSAVIRFWKNFQKSNLIFIFYFVLLITNYFYTLSWELYGQQIKPSNLRNFKPFDCPYFSSLYYVFQTFLYDSCVSALTHTYLT
jgi:hypothetical protein